MGVRNDAICEKCVPGGRHFFVPMMLPNSSGRAHVAIQWTRAPHCPNWGLGLNREEFLQARPDTCPCLGSYATRAAIASLGRWRRRFPPRRFLSICAGPGNLTSLRSAVQSKKALLAMYLSEGGIASSDRAAQFMKALTLMA